MCIKILIKCIKNTYVNNKKQRIFVYKNAFGLKFNTTCFRTKLN